MPENTLEAEIWEKNQRSFNNRAIAYEKERKKSGKNSFSLEKFIYLLVFFLYIVHSRPYYCVFYNTAFRRLGICLTSVFFFVHLNFLDLFFRVPAGVNFPSAFHVRMYICTNFCDYFISQAFFLPHVTRTFFSSSNQWWKRLSICAKRRRDE